MKITDDDIESFTSLKASTNIMNECDEMVKQHVAKKKMDKNIKIELQKKLEAAASSKGLDLQNEHHSNTTKNIDAYYQYHFERELTFNLCFTNQNFIKKVTQHQTHQVVVATFSHPHRLQC